MPRPKRKPIAKPKKDYSSELRIFVPIILFFAIVAGVGIWAARRIAKQRTHQPLRVAGPAWLVEHPAFADAKKEFERLQHDYVVEAAPADGAALVERAAREKPGADLIVGLTGAQVAGLAGRVIAWDDFFDTRTARQDLIQAFLDDATVDGDLLMMPVMGDAVFLLVRPRWLKDAGVAAPFETWTQLTVAVTNLTRGKSGARSRYGLAVEWGEGSAGLIFTSCTQARGAGAGLKTEQASDTLHFWRDLVSEAVCSGDTFASPRAARTAFVEGRAAMAWTLASARQEAADRLGADRVAWVPLPGSQRNGTAVMTYGAVVPKASKQQALAQRFVREHLLAEPFQRAVAESAKRLPALRRNYENLEGAEWQMVLRVLQRSAAVDAPDRERLDRVLTRDLTPAITGSEQPDAALAQAARDLASDTPATQ